MSHSGVRFKTSPTHRPSTAPVNSEGTKRPAGTPKPNVQHVVARLNIPKKRRSQISSKACGSWNRSLIDFCPPSNQSLWVDVKCSTFTGSQVLSCKARTNTGIQNFNVAMAKVTYSTSKNRVQPLGPMRRLRHLVILRLKWLNAAPSRPAAMPIKAKMNISTKWYDISVKRPKLTGTLVPSRPTVCRSSTGPRVSRVIKVATELETNNCVRIRGVM
mmetsp:Transcript_34694/g.80984  ORF Transcript_34694/g.80984 Transcript_34694/m.80984 type:complete len:216 (+) Transcript_34694:1386-2033(+)